MCFYLPDKWVNRNKIQKWNEQVMKQINLSFGEVFSVIHILVGDQVHTS